MAGTNTQLEKVSDLIVAVVGPSHIHETKTARNLFDRRVSKIVAPLPKPEAVGLERPSGTLGIQKAPRLI